MIVRIVIFAFLFFVTFIQIGVNAFAKDSVVQLGVGVEGTVCARLSSGVVKCFGNNFYGNSMGGFLGRKDLGIGESLPPEELKIPKPVYGIKDAVDLSVSVFNSCVVNKTGEVWCWGYDNGAFSTVEEESPKSRNIPVKIANIKNAIKVTNYAAGGCAVINDGTVECWGRMLKDGPKHFNLILPKNKKALDINFTYMPSGVYGNLVSVIFTDKTVAYFDLFEFSIKPAWYILPKNFQVSNFLDHHHPSFQTVDGDFAKLVFKYSPGPTSLAILKDRKDEIGKHFIKYKDGSVRRFDIDQVGGIIDSKLSNYKFAASDYFGDSCMVLNSGKVICIGNYFKGSHQTEITGF